MVGVTEGGLGIDHPVHSFELSEESIERARPLPSRERAAEAEFITAIGAAEQSQELAPKHLGEDLPGQKESWARGADPTGTIRGDPTGGEPGGDGGGGAETLGPSGARSDDSESGR